MRKRKYSERLRHRIDVLAWGLGEVILSYLIGATLLSVVRRAVR